MLCLQLSELATYLEELRTLLFGFEFLIGLSQAQPHHRAGVPSFQYNER